MAEYDYIQFNEVSETEYSNILSAGYTIVRFDGYGKPATFKRAKGGSAGVGLTDLKWIGDDIYINNKPITDDSNIGYMQDLANAGYTYAELKKKRLEKNSQDTSKLDTRKYYSGIPDFIQPIEEKKNPMIIVLILIGGYYIYRRYKK